MSFSASDLTLTSYWYVRKKTTQEGGVTIESTYCTTPSTARAARSFSLAGLPEGSVIHSAVLSGSRSSTGSGTRKIDGAVAPLPLTIAAARVQPGGSLSIEFSWTAEAAAGAVGYHSASLTYAGLTLTVEYTGYTACTAPTSVALSKSEAEPSEALVLSWSGAKGGLNAPIASYEIHRAASLNGPYALLSTVAASALSCAVSAPASAGSYHFRVKAVSSQTGYDSELSAAAASVSVNATAPTPPGSLSVSPQAQYPEGAATLSWSAGADGQNNAVTGYAVYQSAAQDGPFAFLKNASGTSCEVSAPQEGTRYFRVLAVGQSLNSALSTSFAALSADLSDTSDFSFASVTVDAGCALTVIPETNADKAHTLTVLFHGQTVTAQGAAGAESISVTPPLAWLSLMPDSETEAMTVRLETAGAGTVIHTAYLRCPDSVTPTGMGGAAAPVSQAVPAAWGVYLAGLSAAEITFDTAASAPYGASIVGYRIDGPGVHVEGDSLPLSGVSHLLPEGSAQYALSATDSRGRTGVTTLNVTVLPYAEPTLSGILSLRADGQGAEDDEGTYVLAAAEITSSSCGGNNAVTCSVHYRKQGDPSWISAGSLQNGELHFGGGLITLPDNWEVRYTVSDSLGNGGVYFDIVTRAAWELHVMRGGGGWAFGGVADAPGMLKVYGGVLADNVALPFTVDFGTVSSLPATVNSADISAGCIVIGWEIARPGAFAGPLTALTANGSVSIDGALLSGQSSAIKLILQKAN